MSERTKARNRTAWIDRRAADGYGWTQLMKALSALVIYGGEDGFGLIVDTSAIAPDEHGREREHRNRFVTGPGSRDFDTCHDLVDAGLMAAHGPQLLACGGDHFFQVTAAGRRYVREHSPQPPKLTRGQRRYLGYLDADSGLTFGEWLRFAAARPGAQGGRDG